MPQYDPRIDAYIGKSGDFAKPILTYIRDLVHRASPEITETIKWGMPFFEYKGPVCMMAAFKQHCAFGFWKSSRLNDPDKLLKGGDDEAAAGSFGKILTLADLPPDDALVGFIHQTIQINESGVKESKPKKAPAEKKELVTPDDLTDLLSSNDAARKTFDGFSYSHKKEYIEWIEDAKTDTTRQKRLQTTIEWLTEGKSRMWKYSGK